MTVHTNGKLRIIVLIVIVIMVASPVIIMFTVMGVEGREICCKVDGMTPTDEDTSSI